MVHPEKETDSGVKLNPRVRSQVIALAQDLQIDAVLVTELTRWGRSTLDLIHTLQDLQSWGVSLIAQTGLQFDLSTPQGRLVASMIAALAEFERDLIRERIRSGIAAAHARGVRKPNNQSQLILENLAVTARTTPYHVLYQFALSLLQMESWGSWGSWGSYL